MEFETTVDDEKLHTTVDERAKKIKAMVEPQHLMMLVMSRWLLGEYRRCCRLPFGAPEAVIADH
jgi:hypothetical protein